MKTVVTLNFEHHTPIFTGFRHTLCCFIKKMQNWKDYCQQKQTNKQTRATSSRNIQCTNSIQVLLSIISIWMSWHILSLRAIRVLITPLKCHLSSLLVKSGKKKLAICSIKLDTLCILHILAFNGSFKWMQLVFTSGLRNHQLAFLQLLFSYII